ncbi:hypothetical protein AB0P17_31940 [Streptomyces sp. NPDC088124]|uniref:hypothetical protein n=1 Tax=Streptomyces sp. NPDC088124 TaxID=3154654 RepID=UPI003430A821
MPEFDALAGVYARTAGPGAESTLECRGHAAHCRANLGQATVALREFQEVLEVVSDAAGDASETALDLRRSIGVLLFSEGRRTEAEGVLDARHEDMCVLLGEDDEETREIAALLARLRGPEGCSRKIGLRPRSGALGGRQVGLYAGFCRPVASRRPGRRPSIQDRRCRASTTRCARSPPPPEILGLYRRLDELSGTPAGIRTRICTESSLYMGTVTAWRSLRS